MLSNVPDEVTYWHREKVAGKPEKGAKQDSVRVRRRKGIMKTELDLAMDGAFGALTADGAMFHTVPIERFGRQLPMIAAAPPHLPAYFAYFCATQGEKTFIVDGDTRLSFADVYKAARHVAGGLVEGLNCRRANASGSPRAIRPTGSLPTWPR